MLRFQKAFFLLSSALSLGQLFVGNLGIPDLPMFTNGAEQNMVRMKIGTTQVVTRENAVAPSPSLAPLCAGKNPVRNGASVKSENNAFEMGKFRRNLMEAGKLRISHWGNRKNQMGQMVSRGGKT